MVYSKEQKMNLQKLSPEETQFPDTLNKTFKANALCMFKEWKKNIKN